MKTLLMSGGIAALLMAAVGCTSTETSMAYRDSDDGRNNNYADYRLPNTSREYIGDGLSATNTPESDVASRRDVGNFGNQVGATAWQDSRSSSPRSDANISLRNSGDLGYNGTDRDNRSIASNNTTGTTGNNGNTGTSGVGPGSPVSAGTASDLPRMGSDRAAVGNVGSTDELFMVNAALSGMYEIEAGQVALRKSESAKIRELANKIINDHTAAANELKQIAQSKNVKLPTQLDEAHRSLITKLENADKASFDTEFLRQQASAHRDAIQTFDDESRNGKDAQAKAFASKTIGTLQNHLNMVEEPHNTASEK